MARTVDIRQTENGSTMVFSYQNHRPPSSRQRRSTMNVVYMRAVEGTLSSLGDSADVLAFSDVFGFSFRLQPSAEVVV